MFTLYMNKLDLTFYRLQWLICYKTKPKLKQTKVN